MGIQQRIVCAANRDPQTGLVVCGARHFDNVMRRVIEQSNIPCKNMHWEQGFIDNRGEYLSRERAMEIAVAAGQYVKIGHEVELYSEDLY
jgi:hypothetical protein